MRDGDPEEAKLDLLRQFTSDPLIHVLLCCIVLYSTVQYFELGSFFLILEFVDERPGLLCPTWIGDPTLYG